MTLKPLNCPNCGGKVNASRMVCEYCGTQFDSSDMNMGVLRVDHYTSPTRVVKVETRIPNELHAIAPDQVVDYAKREIAENLVENLLKGNLIEFCSEMDWKECQQIISARLRVLDPHYRF